MSSREPRRVHLPIVGADAGAAPAEPAVAEGARSLASWSAVRRDLAADPALRDALARDPAAILARYGIRGTPGEIAAFVAALRRGG